jgi:hypothetical protein
MANRWSSAEPIGCIATRQPPAKPMALCSSSTSTELPASRAMRAPSLTPLACSAWDRVLIEARISPPVQARPPAISTIGLAWSRRSALTTGDTA